METTPVMWSATTSASDEATVRTAALSVRQRKLLALLATPMTVESMSAMSGIPHAEIETNLQRFEKLGLAQSDAAAAAPAALRSSTFGASSAAASDGKSKMPLIIGGVALTAIAAAVFMFSGSGSPPTPSAPAPATVAASGSAPSSSTVPAAPAAPAAAAAAAPSDGATTSVFVSGAPATPEPPKAAAKERELAAKEAAARDAAKKAAPSLAPTAPVVAPQPAVAAPAPVAVAPAPAPVAAPTPAPAPAAPPPAPAPAPVAAAPAPAPAVARAPAPAAAREGALISRVEPVFPRNAEVDKGTVRARLTVNATGAVTNVEIVEASPPRVFDRNVRAALTQWRYEGTGETQSKLVEISFAR